MATVPLPQDPQPDDLTPEPIARPRVVHAKPAITKGKELLKLAENRKTAIRGLAYRSAEHEGETFEVLAIQAVNLEGESPGPWGVVEISWRRMIRMIDAQPLGTWHVGRLEAADDQHGATILSPVSELDPEALAEVLAPFERPLPRDDGKGALPTAEDQPAIEAGSGGSEPGDAPDSKDNMDDVPF